MATVTNTNNSLLSGSISAADASVGITKDGSGVLILSGGTANTYTGPTVVNAGRLTLAKTGGATAATGSITVGDNTGSDFLSLGGSNQIYDGAPITLNGGTLEAADNSDSVGMLTLSNNSAIDLGSGSSSILAFADSSAMTWNPAAILNILNWSGSPTGGGSEQIKFDSANTALTGPQLAQIFFVNPSGFDPGTYPATFSNDNPGELIPAAVPEPGCIALLGGGATMTLLRRRRIARL